MKKTLLTLLILWNYLFVSGYAQKQESSLKDPTQKMSKKEIKVLIDSLDNALHNWYVYQDKVDLMLTTVKKNYKSGAYDKVEKQVE